MTSKLQSLSNWLTEDAWFYALAVLTGAGFWHTMTAMEAMGGR